MCNLYVRTVSKWQDQMNVRVTPYEDAETFERMDGRIDQLLRPSTIQKILPIYEYYPQETIRSHLCIELDGDFYEWKRL